MVAVLENAGLVRVVAGGETMVRAARDAVPLWDVSPLKSLAPGP